jgi:hypothetical protein
MLYNGIMSSCTILILWLSYHIIMITCLQFFVIPENFTHCHMNIFLKMFRKNFSTSIQRIFSCVFVRFTLVEIQTKINKHCFILRLLQPLGTYYQNDAAPARCHYLVLLIQNFLWHPWNPLSKIKHYKLFLSSIFFFAI